MIIHKNFNLKPYNTFGIEAFAKEFVTITTLNELKEILKKTTDFFILGGGSNLLLTQNIDKLVIHNQLKGIEICKQTDDFVWIKAQAGENWHQFVLFCIENNFGGIENLSLIPGNVGTTPIQNIGAYGVEIKDTLFSCEALNIETLEIETFSNAACEFDYRESVFKNTYKNKYIISSVTFQLTKQDHKIKTNYGAIADELNKKQIQNPSIKEVSEAVIAIRESKLPNPKVLGNSGSFFKNPIISAEKYTKLVKKHPEMPHYKVSEKEVKVPAGWLIEQAGFKGKRIGDAGVHTQQALVLVNYGNATGQEILNLSKKIQQTIFETFEIEIEAEVNIL